MFHLVSISTINNKFFVSRLLDPAANTFDTFEPFDYDANASYDLGKLLNTDPVADDDILVLKDGKEVYSDEQFRRPLDCA